MDQECPEDVGSVWPGLVDDQGNNTGEARDAAYVNDTSADEQKLKTIALAAGYRFIFVNQWWLVVLTESLDRLRHRVFA